MVHILVEHVSNMNLLSTTALQVSKLKQPTTFQTSTRCWDPFSVCRLSSGSPSARIDERMWRLHGNGARILPRFLCFFPTSMPVSPKATNPRSPGRAAGTDPGGRTRGRPSAMLPGFPFCQKMRPNLASRMVGLHGYTAVTTAQPSQPCPSGCHTPNARHPIHH